MFSGGSSMGFRFRKSVRLMPGVRLNFSNRGVSTSLGGSGATVNIGKRGVRATAGLPGTGLSYSQQLLSTSGRTEQPTPLLVPNTPIQSPSRWYGLFAGMLVVLSIGFCSIRDDDPAPTPAAVPLASEPAGETVSVTVTAPNLNCRANPGTSGQLVAQFAKGAVLTVSPQHVAGWRWVVTSGENGCWVAARYLSDAQ